MKREVITGILDKKAEELVTELDGVLKALKEATTEKISNNIRKHLEYVYVIGYLDGSSKTIPTVERHRAEAYHTAEKNRETLKQ